MTMKNEIVINSLADIGAAAREFIEKTGNHRLFALYGHMGAGKTTFTVALCKAMGVEDNVNSPTFAIVNEYLLPDGEPMYHFDFYRIRNNAEAMDIGVEDYFYSGHLCVMEWPENIEDLLPEETLAVYITVNPDQSRTVSWED